MFPELMVVLGEHPGGRMKIIIKRELFAHGIQASSELVFPSNCVNARNIVDTLMEMHANESMRSD